MRTCSDLATHLYNILQQWSYTYDEMYIIFDLYGLQDSLKKKTRQRLTGVHKTVRYSMIAFLWEKVSMKKFFLDIHTKNELTSYLAQKIIVKYTSQLLLL